MNYYYYYYYIHLANTVEAVIVSIRAQLIAGGARLDFHNKHDYTEQEVLLVY